MADDPSGVQTLHHANTVPFTVHVFLPQETIPSEAGSALRSVHPAEAPLHRDGVHGERLPAELPQREEREAQEGDAAEHVPGHM